MQNFKKICLDRFSSSRPVSNFKQRTRYEERGEDWNHSLTKKTYNGKESEFNWVLQTL